MKRLAVAFGVVLAGVSAASAADLAVRPITKAPPLLSPIPVSNWTGVYLGGFVGGTWATANYCAFGGGAYSCNSFNMSEIFGGGLLGYEYELPNRFVVGARISAPFGGTVTAGTVPAIFAGLPAGTSVTGKFNWATTVNATIGYDMGQWMPYMGVGVAFADLGVTVNSPAGATSAEEQQTGLNVLAGIKYAWMPGWELGVQYNYTTFARQNYNFAGPAVGGVLIGQLPISINQSSITGIIDYKFH